MIFAAVVLMLPAVFGLTRLTVDSGIEALVDRDGDAYVATESVRRTFGEDPVVVLIQGDLRELLLAPNILRILNLEACLAGNVPEDAKPLPGPCQELAKLRPAQLVSGPATFLNQAAVGITGELSRRIEIVGNRAERAARAAERRALALGESEEVARQEAERASAAISARFFKQAAQLAGRYGLSGIPGLGDPAFTQAVVFDPTGPPGTPKARLSYLFPSPDAAQIIVRLRPDLTAEERTRALELITAAVRETRPRKRCATPGSEAEAQPCFQLEGGSYLVSGAPVVVDAVAGELQNSLIVLLCVAVALMAIVLPLVLRSRAPLLPGAVALSAAVTTFGVYGLFGGRLTIAALAVLPILIGLAVDYTIQTQSRFDEFSMDGDPELSAGDAAYSGAPTLAGACLATAVGFAMLAFSPTPMVRGFGLILAVGVTVAFAWALIVGSAALVLRERVLRRRAERKGIAASEGHRAPGGTDENESLFQAAVTLPGALAAVLGRAHARAAARVGEVRRAWLAVVARRPVPVLIAALLLAVLGWGLGTRTEATSEIAELMPPSMPAVRDLHKLQETTEVSGELDVIVTAPDLTDPEVIAWMAGFKRRVLEQGGYGGESPNCREAAICPGPSLTDFISDAERGVSRKRVQDLVAALPDYDLRAVAEVDPESGELGSAANIAFMIKLMPLEEQQRLIEMIEAEIEADGGPPEGVEVAVGGLPVIAAESASALTSSRWWLTLVAFLAIALVLAAVMRSARRLVATLGPILLATGWSALMLFALGVPLNPVSAVLGVMVVAISTEFSVILASRYRQEREAGGDPREALESAWATSGAAVLASGVTVIAGFAALLASDIPMLRDFGLVTVVDLAVSLAGVMLVLPALLLLVDKGGPIDGFSPVEREIVAKVERLFELDRSTEGGDA